MAAIYLRSKEVKGANFVSYNGVSYRRTGVFKKLSSTTTTPVSDVDLFYVNSCSAADYGQKGLINGGTLSVPASATEFQLKFDGNNPGDEGILILGDAPNTCNVTLSVNSGGNLVFDPLSSGDPGGFEFITYPTTLNYTDCNSTVWNITLAAKGSFYLAFATSSPAAGGGGGGGVATCTNPVAYKPGVNSNGGDSYIGATVSGADYNTGANGSYEVGEHFMGWNHFDYRTQASPEFVISPYNQHDWKVGNNEAPHGAAPLNTHTWPMTAHIYHGTTSISGSILCQLPGDIHPSTPQVFEDSLIYPGYTLTDPLSTARGDGISHQFYFIMTGTGYGGAGSNSFGVAGMAVANDFEDMSAYASDPTTNRFTNIGEHKWYYGLNPKPATYAGGAKQAFHAPNVKLPCGAKVYFTAHVNGYYAQYVYEYVGTEKYCQAGPNPAGLHGGNFAETSHRSTFLIYLSGNGQGDLQPNYTCLPGLGSDGEPIPLGYGVFPGITNGPWPRIAWNEHSDGVSTVASGAFSLSSNWPAGPAADQAVGCAQTSGVTSDRTVNFRPGVANGYVLENHTSHDVIFKSSGTIMHTIPAGETSFYGGQNFSPETDIAGWNGTSSPANWDLIWEFDGWDSSALSCPWGWVNLCNVEPFHTNWPSSGNQI